MKEISDTFLALFRNIEYDYFALYINNYCQKY